jgi:hypothetical protein
MAMTTTSRAARYAARVLRRGYRKVRDEKRRLPYRIRAELVLVRLLRARAALVARAAARLVADVQADYSTVTDTISDLSTVTDTDSEASFPTTSEGSEGSDAG